MCEITLILLPLWCSLGLIFSFFCTFLVIDDTAACRAALAHVVLTLTLLFRVRNDHQISDRSLKCFSGREVHSWAMMLFLDLCQDKRIFSSILYSDWSFFLYLITFVYFQKFSTLGRVTNRSESHRNTHQQQCVCPPSNTQQIPKYTSWTFKPVHSFKCQWWSDPSGSKFFSLKEKRKFTKDINNNQNSSAIPSPFMLHSHVQGLTWSGTIVDTSCLLWLIARGPGAVWGVRVSSDSPNHQCNTDAVSRCVGMWSCSVSVLDDSAVCIALRCRWLPVWPLVDGSVSFNSVLRPNYAPLVTHTHCFMGLCAVCLCA